MKRFEAVDDGAVIGEVSQGWRNIFSQYALQVFDSCFDHVFKIIEDIDGNEHDDEDTLHDFGECIKACSLFLGWEACLERGYERLKRAADHGDHDANCTTLRALRIQSVLRCINFVLKAGKRKQIVNQGTSLQALLCTFIPAVASLSLHILKVALEIINVAAYWINARPESLNILFPFIVNSLSLQATNSKKATDLVYSISSTAAYVLGNICRICADSMPPEVLTVYESIGQHGLKLKDEVFVIEGMSSIVSKLPPAEASKGLERLLSPMALDLRGAIDAKNAELVIRSLEHMVAVFKNAKLNQSPHSTNSRDKQMLSATNTGISINTEHPVLLLMKGVWHLFEEIIVKFYENEQVMEKLCRVYKHSVRNAKNNFFPLLEKLLEQMVEVFSKCPISSFLYTCSICVGEFGSPSIPYNTFEVRLRVFQTYRALNECMCRHLASIESFANNPCLVEDYFNLSNRVCKRSNEFFCT